MELKLAEELERKAKRQKLLMQIQILEGYRRNVRQALERLEDGKTIYRAAHASYTPSWQGETRQAYEQMASELNGAGNRSYTVGNDLMNAISGEIRRLQDKADALR
ncbi:hypothetical protein WQ57_06385 [Mesobacillus campisalis]|uniref:DUF5082 domain-containing protein n=1 Tax=Mesobacillus campisalis TaxID=1408103 RepID=A0A0M2SWN1_9BACI|nr:DUF5082 domain-containing protein [Mesobacillus campisalis]KKK38969.1 hypothetical protein WQ57_06385 [Mesobacillus campisalis]